LKEFFGVGLSLGDVRGFFFVSDFCSPTCLSYVVEVASLGGVAYITPGCWLGVICGLRLKSRLPRVVFS